MKYLRHMIVFGFIVLFIGLLVVITGVGKNSISIEATAKSKPESFQEARFFRVYFDKIEIAHNIVISMNAVESKYEKGYVIVEVTNSDEYDKLLNTGLQIEEIANPQADKIAAIQQAALLESTGIPSYPCYRTVEETFSTAESIVANHPELATWTDEGDSWEKENQLGGYDMKVLRLTNSSITDPDKPKIFLTGAIHAREYATAELVTRLAEYLVDNYGTEADATWMLDHHEIHIMLQANPDGRKQAETGLSWRKNTNQNYCSPTSNYRGADLNRNFEFKWNCCGGSSDYECDSTYHGPYAASEPETNAIQDYVLGEFEDQRGPNDDDPAPLDATGLYIDVHSHGRLVLWPWGWTPDPSPNATQLQTLGRKFAYFNGHEPKQGYGLYPTDGTTTTFTYGELGIASYTFELGTEFFEDCSYFENSIMPGNMPALLYAIKVARTPYITPAGPEAINLALDIGSSVPSGTIVTISVTMDDTRYNNSNGTEPSQNITAAEYYVDVPPWVTDPTPVAIAMSPSDGTFDNTVEAVEATIDTTGWSEEQHIIFVRGQDTDGNWGPFSAIFITIENQPCNDSSECDDGLFCNGAETCIDNICHPGTDPCPGQQCNEDFDQCVAAPVFEDDFESGNAQGWDLYASGSTASTGDWVIGDPVGTVSGSDQAQPEDAYEGTGCIFTAQNSSLGVNDVDGGVVYLVSPVIDLSGADSAELVYVRWFYNRDTGEDSGDFFVAQVSDDNGTNWVALETLGTSQSANTWTSKAYTLESYISLTSTVRVRFGAADGPSLGNIIEAALDNVKVWAYGGCETNEDCDDGLFCNGVETCDSGACQAGSDPCPGRLCDEAGDVCVDCLVNGDCDDGLYCNGAEICVSGVCQPGIDVDCDDSIACTADSCNEGTDTCDNTPDHGFCDDGLFCNGAETCDTGLGCQAGNDPCPDQYCDEAGDTCYDCEDNADCDDGLFCNGAETCVSGDCQAGSDPCPGQSCDEANDQCVSGPVAKLEAGSVTVGGTTVTVSLTNSYISPIIACAIHYSDNSTPVVARITNVTSTSFDVYLQNPSGGGVSAENVSYLVVEEGNWTIDGVKIEAQKYLSTVTDENNSWVGEAVTYGQSYTSPVVIGQVMSDNDPDWSVFWCQGTSRKNPPSASTLRTGKTVCEDSDTTRADETIGVIVFEAGHGSIGGIAYEALLGADSIRGVGNSPPYMYTFNSAFATAPTVALTTMAGVDGGNGGWSYTYGATMATTTTMYLAVDEDQINDSERNHTTEQVGYVVFESPVVYSE